MSVVGEDDHDSPSESESSDERPNEQEPDEPITRVSLPVATHFKCKWCKQDVPYNGGLYTEDKYCGPTFLCKQTRHERKCRRSLKRKATREAKCRTEDELRKRRKLRKSWRNPPNYMYKKYIK